MQANRRNTSSQPDLTPDAIAWFARLLHARRSRQGAMEAQARQELKSLGISVRIAMTKGASQ